MQVKFIKIQKYLCFQVYKKLTPNRYGNIKKLIQCYEERWVVTQGNQTQGTVLIS
jgi:hypothetical protein